MKYRDLDNAIRNCLNLLAEHYSEVNAGNKEDRVPVIFFSKADLTSAFRILPLKICHFMWLVMKAEDPTTGKIVYFIDKCLPFGASISCFHFQRVSNSLEHVTSYLIRVRNRITNYMDDFLFIDLTKVGCNAMLQTFKEVCAKIKFPVSEEKTCYAEPIMIFLGTLLNGILHVIAIPEEKRLKALNIIQWICSKRKGTMKQLQRLAGILNFLNHAIYPGRAFT